MNSIYSKHRIIQEYKNANFKDATKLFNIRSLTFVHSSEMVAHSALT